MGGQERVATVDILESEAFLKDVFQTLLRNTTKPGQALCAVDCGAGIGRISKDLLLRYFDVVSILR